MRERDLAHLRDIVRRVAESELTLTRSDGVALLILLRDVAPKRSMLRDLGHSVAHDVRDHGGSFGYLEKYSLNLRRVLIHGGRIRPKTIFPIGEVIEEMNSVLSNLRVPERLGGNPRTRWELSRIIAGVLDGTAYKLRVATGTLSMGRLPDGLPAFSASLLFHDDIDGAIVIKAGSGVAIATPWMIKEDEIRAYADGEATRRKTPTRPGG